MIPRAVRGRFKEAQGFALGAALGTGIWSDRALKARANYIRASCRTLSGVLHLINDTFGTSSVLKRTFSACYWGGRILGLRPLGVLENTPSALGNNPVPTRKSRRGSGVFVLFQNVQNYGQRKSGELPTVAELSSKFLNSGF